MCGLRKDLCCRTSEFKSPKISQIDFISLYNEFSYYEIEHTTSLNYRFFIRQSEKINKILSVRDFYQRFQRRGPRKTRKANLHYVNFLRYGFSDF